MSTRVAWALGALVLAPAALASTCAKPVYLTIDTGHMGVAEHVATVLHRHGVKATFFLASEPTQSGGHSLDDQWAPWWRARAAEGHDFGSHTWAHDIWQADTPEGFRFKTQAGRQAPSFRTLTSAQYCAELKRPAERWRAMTGQEMAPIFRAPGGKTSPALIAAAKACGYTHVGWTPNGFLGDELSSESNSNAQLLRQALRRVREGDVLLMHLGIWSRRDPWAPAVLEPLVTGLKAKGLCFAPLREHPDYAKVMQR